MFRVKSYFLVKEEYPKGLVLDLERGNNPVKRTSSAPPLTNYNSKGYSKDGDRALLL